MKQVEAMSLELLPNEILLDVFNYFDGFDLLRTFYGLNSRLNYLLHDPFRNRSIRFNSISKRDFDIICQQHLPRMAEYIWTLHLSDNEDTPKQVELFLSHCLSFNLLTELRSLSLSNMRSYQTLMKVMEECHRLPHLVHLDLCDCYFQDNQVDFQSIVNHIWSLPELKRCTIGIGFIGQTIFCLPSVVSSSLESISIQTIQVRLDQLGRLFECTPGLQSLSISVPSFVDNNYVPAPLFTLIDLSITSRFTCSATNMVNLLQNTPNLRRLKIDLSSELINGDQLEEWILNHLPSLQKFQCKMKATLPVGQSVQTRAEGLMNSFGSSFWIDEHQWFVRCVTWNRTIFLYTLPSDYKDNLPALCKSTCLADGEEDFYDSVTKIISPTFFDQPIPSCIRLNNINYLCLNLPINERFWSIVPNFNVLQSLELRFHVNAFQSQVQALLNRAPRLKIVTINQHESTPLQTALFQYKNVAVRELDLRNINHYFREEECMKLSLSLLDSQCEKLSILVENFQSIISLIEHMSKLRTLNVRCKDEKFTEQSPVKTKPDGLEYFIEDKNACLERLKNHLPPACIVIRDPKLVCNILIWV